jgi:hypothetical protein
VSKTPGSEFDSVATFVADQATANIKQSEELFAVVTKQAVANVKTAQQIALDTVGKFSEIAGEAVPSLPEWLPTATLSQATRASFDLAEQILGAQKAIAESVLELFAPAAN